MPEDPPGLFISPGHFARSAPPHSALRNFRPFFRSRTAQQLVSADRCCFCGLPVREDAVTPGPGFGRAHRACFSAWDRMQEALELEFGGTLPSPFSDLAELELEAPTPAARAA